MSLLSKTEYKLTEYAAEIMIYFERFKLIEITKKILVECDLQRPLNPQEWIGVNIKRIAKEIYQDSLNEGRIGIIKSLHLSPSFFNRIVIFGRPGSGRKTQAFNLAETLNLVLIDAETLIYQHLRGIDERPNDPLERELQISFYYDNCLAKSKALLKIIARRVLEKDCLSRGWILLNFTHTLHDFKDIMENFKIPPNKLIYLKCNERTCMHRLLKMSTSGGPYRNNIYYEHEMRFFNQQKSEIIDFLSKRHELVYLNASKSYEDVTTYLLSRCTKSSYVMYFKQNSEIG